MRKIKAAINMTIDGYCDHTSGVPDEEVHEHYKDLLNGADSILYGRTTFELMKFWQKMVKEPSGEKAMDEFALAIDKIQKIVFSNTLKETGWETAKFADRPLKEVVSELKSKPGKDVFAGSRSLINQLLKLGLIDELQLCVHPVLAGGGLPLFEKSDDLSILKLVKTKTFAGGAVILYYAPNQK